MEKSPKGIAVQMRHSDKMSKKFDFMLIFYTFKITGNKIMVSAIVLAAYRVYSRPHPLWKDVTRHWYIRMDMWRDADQNNSFFSSNTNCCHYYYYFILFSTTRKVSRRPICCFCHCLFPISCIHLFPWNSRHNRWKLVDQGDKATGFWLGIQWQKQLKKKKSYCKQGQ